MPKRIHKIVLDSNKSAPLFEINKLEMYMDKEKL